MILNNFPSSAMYGPAARHSIELFTRPIAPFAASTTSAASPPSQSPIPPPPTYVPPQPVAPPTPRYIPPSPQPRSEPPTGQSTADWQVAAQLHYQQLVASKMDQLTRQGYRPADARREAYASVEQTHPGLREQAY